MILYVGTRRSSSWSLRAYLALAHSGAAFETRTVWLDHADSGEKLRAIGPTSRVPVLHDGALVIPDSLAICEYVAEQHPKMWPADRAQRARARGIACEMHSGFAALRTNMPMALLDDRAGVGHTPEALADAARVMEIWREALAASGGPFLFGAYTIADAMFAPVTTRFTTYGVAMDAVARGYTDAIQRDPAFVQWRADAIAERAIEPAQ